jgi:hypothetical protein
VGPDPVARGISGSLAQGNEQIRIKVGHGRNLVIEEGHAVRDGTGSRT